MQRVSFGSVLLLAATALVGCDSKPKGTVEGDPVRNAAPNGGPAKVGAGVEKSLPSTNGGKNSTENSGTKNGGMPIDAATELTRLQHKAFVVFYKGFTEDQMKAYIDHIDKNWVTGKEPKRT